MTTLLRATLASAPRPHAGCVPSVALPKHVVPASGRGDKRRGPGSRAPLRFGDHDRRTVQKPALRRERQHYEPPSAADLERAIRIDRKFSGLRLGLVDATVAALAERLGILRLLTTNSAFLSVRIGRSWTQALELVVAPPVRRMARDRG